MYIGAIPTPAATESRQEFLATANQTVFSTTGGTVGYCDCFLNGVKMANSDFSFDGADVTLTTGAAAGDILAVVMRQADNALVALPITDSAGNNVLSEANSVVSIGSGVQFPAGHIIKMNYYTIGSGTLANASFPADNTIPQRTEGTEVWSQSITPSTNANYLLIQANVKLNETSSLTNEMALGLFISDSLDALVVSQGLNERSSGGGPFNDFPAFINYRMTSWGASAKTLSLRSSGAQAYNYFDQYGSYSSGSYYNGTITSSVIVWEIV